MEAMEVQSPLLTGGALLLMGLVLAFFGYRLMRSMARIQSALIFACVAMEAGTEAGWAPLASLGAALGLGILGYLLGDLMYHVNIFLLGAIVGVVVSFAVMIVASWEISLLGILAGAAIGLVAGGILAVLFQRPIGILLSSIAGSALMALGGCILVTGNTLNDVQGGLQWGFLAMIGLLSVAGCVVQVRNTKNLPDRRDDGKSSKAESRTG